MKRSVTIVLPVLALWVFSCHSPSQPGIDLPYRSIELPVEDRLKDLIGRMTLDEKISQMQYNAPAIGRLDIPAYNWWNECLHGVGRAGLATVFPQAIGMAASWNDSLIHQVATAISDEARAKYNAFVAKGKRGIYEGLTFWTPNINIFRDPRWGRGQETYGEDPYLTGRMAVSFIKGLQGNNKHYLKLVATAKHFAVHSGPESTRHTINVRPSKQDLYETYLPAFEASVKKANVQSVMCAYNRFEDQPCCGSNILLQTILRNDWQFKGYIVSDCGAVSDFYKTHEVSKTPEAAATLALESGTDLNCGDTYSHLKEAVAQGLITEDKIDQALYRLFNARFRLGMFDPEDSVPWSNLSPAVVRSNKHQQQSLQMARESIVLLKNEQHTLPLSKDIRSVAIIGPNADHQPSMLGNYHGTSPHMITPLQGISDKLGDKVKVNYAQGSLFAEGMPSLHPIPGSVLSSDGEEGLKGDYSRGNNFDGKPEFTRYDSAVDFTWIQETPVTKQTADSFAIEWKGVLTPRKTGKHHIGVEAGNAVKVYLNDSLYLNFDNVHHPLRKSFAIQLEQGKPYQLKIRYYNYGPDPQMHLLWSEPDQVPGILLEQAAIDAARKSDVVIMLMGLTPLLEGEEMPVHIKGFSGGDRTDIKLPDVQQQLIQKISALGKPIVLVMLGGSAIAVNWADQHVPAIVEAWYPGEFGGAAIADVLFGDFNPSGKLPLTFYASVADLPGFEDYSMMNRTYKYFKGSPLYPFGYGLSYTQFAYQQLQMPDSLTIGDTLKVSIAVKNTGKRAGQEVVQLYVTDRQASVRTPLHTLQGFQKVLLQPGESKKLVFLLSPKQLGLVTEGGNALLEAGKIKISIGSGQPNLPKKFTPYPSSIKFGTVVLIGESLLL